MDGADAPRYLVFELQGRRYALSITAVDGLFERPVLRTVFGAPETVLGLAEWRGRLLTVVDLPRLLGTRGPEGPDCLVRLAPPHHHAAFRLPASIRLDREESPGTDEAPARLIDPGRILDQVVRTPEAAR